MGLMPGKVSGSAGWVAALVLACCAVPAQAKEDASSSFVAVVTKVADGDTLWLRPAQCDGRRQCKPFKLRIQGIDAPERCQAWGEQSAEALRSKVLNQEVQVSTSSKDVYGRALGRVRLNQEDVGAWMVLQGNAWNYHYQRDPGPYVPQQAQAQQGRRGLFAEPNVTEPRVFRKTHGPCGAGDAR